MKVVIKSTRHYKQKSRYNIEYSNPLNDLHKLGQCVSGANVTWTQRVLVSRKLGRHILVVNTVDSSRKTPIILLQYWTFCSPLVVRPTTGKGWQNETSCLPRVSSDLGNLLRVLLLILCEDIVFLQYFHCYLPQTLVWLHIITMKLRSYILQIHIRILPFTTRKPSLLKVIWFLNNS